MHITRTGSHLSTLEAMKMLVHTDYLWFNTKKRQEFIRITDEIAGIVSKSGVKEGTCSFRRCTSRPACS